VLKEGLAFHEKRSYVYIRPNESQGSVVLSLMIAHAAVPGCCPAGLKALVLTLLMSLPLLFDVLMLLAWIFAGEWPRVRM
jgi:hypothetical protein